MKRWTISAVMMWLEVWHLHANYTFNACWHSGDKIFLKPTSYAVIFSRHEAEDIVHKPADYAFNARRCEVEDPFHMKTDMQLLLLLSGRHLPHKKRYAAFYYGVEDIFHMKTDMQLFLLWSRRHLPHENRCAILLWSKGHLPCENRYAALAVVECKTPSMWLRTFNSTATRWKAPHPPQACRSRVQNPRSSKGKTPSTRVRMRWRLSCIIASLCISAQCSRSPGM